MPSEGAEAWGRLARWLCVLLALPACSGHVYRPEPARTGLSALRDEPSEAAVPREPEEEATAPEGGEEEEGVVDDDGEGDAEEESAPAEPPGAEPAPRPHPLDGWSAAAIRRAVHDDLKSLGSMSVGSPNAGALVNGERAEPSELLELVDRAHAFGTRETLEYLSDAIRAVHAHFPDTPPLALGHISAEHGGPLQPHVSHQSGRDVDISFYYRDGARWYTRGTERNLDLARTWAFVRALVTDTDVEMILVDHSIQALLRRYALEHGENAQWVDGLFQISSHGQRPLVRHAPGHATHIHIRFYNPVAQETARRAQPALVAEGVLPEVVSFVRYRAKRGDTLIKIAKRFNVSVQAVKRANGLRSNLVQEQREYRIPLRGVRAPAASAPLKLPPRRLPPPSEPAAPAKTSLGSRARGTVQGAPSCSPAPTSTSMSFSESRSRTSRLCACRERCNVAPPRPTASGLRGTTRAASREFARSKARG